jgi:hypothetical protein
MAMMANRSQGLKSTVVKEFSEEEFDDAGRKSSRAGDDIFLRLAEA